VPVLGGDKIFRGVGTSGLAEGGSDGARDLIDACPDLLRVGSDTNLLSSHRQSLSSGLDTTSWPRRQQEARSLARFRCSPYAKLTAATHKVSHYAELAGLACSPTKKVHREMNTKLKRANASCLFSR
jgi:hypothetical protein